MRRYTIGVNNTTKIVDVEAVGSNLFRVLIDGRLIDVTLEDHRDLAHSAVTPAVVPRGEVTHGELAGGAPQPPAASPPPTALRPSTPANASRAPVVSATQADAGRDKMTAQMPGVVLSVDVTVGAEV